VVRAVATLSLVAGCGAEPSRRVPALGPCRDGAARTKRAIVVSTDRRLRTLRLP
jgi:hypothetical protein